MQPGLQCSKLLASKQFFSFMLCKCEQNLPLIYPPQCKSTSLTVIMDCEETVLLQTTSQGPHLFQNEGRQWGGTPQKCTLSERGGGKPRSNTRQGSFLSFPRFAAPATKVQQIQINFIYTNKNQCFPSRVAKPVSPFWITYRRVLKEIYLTSMCKHVMHD